MTFLNFHTMTLKNRIWFELNFEYIFETVGAIHADSTLPFFYTKIEGNVAIDYAINKVPETEYEMVIWEN